jgi:hypothetical protein
MRAEGSLRGLTQMNSFSLTAAAAVSLGLLCSPASAGGVLTEATISPSAGGQNAVVGTFSSLGDLAPAGSYFIEITGLSAGGFRLAIDGNVAAISDPNPVGAAPVPEISTWAMIAVGFACVAFLGWRFQD